MQIRFGYVAISKVLDVSPNRMMTYTTYKNLSDSLRIEKLNQKISQNLSALKKIMNYNIENSIHFYRMTSNLIPLGTHPDVSVSLIPFLKEFDEISSLIKKSHLRIDMHPDQFNVLNSLDEGVIENSLRNLKFHHEVMNDLGLTKAPFILHVGSGKPNKEQALYRFIKTYHRIEPALKSRIVVENDDKVFTIEDILTLNQEIGVPIVFDSHHHFCNPSPIQVDAIIKSWKDRQLLPKMHLSSSKDGLLSTHHADYIRLDDFLHLIDIFRRTDRDFDIMIEAKMKDVAMWGLIDAIKREFPEWNWLDPTTLKL